MGDRDELSSCAGVSAANSFDGLRTTDVLFFVFNAILQHVGAGESLGS